MNVKAEFRAFTYEIFEGIWIKKITYKIESFSKYILVSYDEKVVTSTANNRIFF